MKYFAGLFILISVLIACKKKTIELNTTETFAYSYPNYFPEPVYQFSSSNQQTKARFELGRYLFYDPILSLDSSISCNSCHFQAHGFADHNVVFSTGVNQVKGTRNAPALINLIWMTNFMWDGGVNNLEVQPLVPITAQHEMFETFDHVLYKLNNSKFYRDQFKQAYGIDKIDSQHLLWGLTQFLAMLNSSDSKFDQVQKGTATFTANEQQGYQIYQQNCAYCHPAPLFTDNKFRNTGLEASIVDIGREKISLDSNDRGKFKVPTLRNVEFTYPYMHDGRFISLDEVIEFYSTGIQQSSTTDKYLAQPFYFSKTEKLALKSFLLTLSDYTFIGTYSLGEPKR